MSEHASTRRRFLAAAGAAAAGASSPLLSACRAFEEDLGRVDRVVRDGAMPRDAYTLDPAITYLNHGSIGTIPKIVQQARARYLAVCETNPWLHMWAGLWEEAREHTRARAAELLGCAPSEVAINHNTTEGFNLLASGLPLGEGDEVVFSSLNHAGASVCWQHRSVSRGFEVKRFEFPEARVGELSDEDVVALHAEHIDDRTRVLCFPHVDNLIGLRHPVRALTAMARSKGVRWVAVDGAQSLGMIPVDVRELGVDVYACSPHKWVQAPKGVGLLYATDAVQRELRPHHVTWGQERWQGTVRVFEDFGTRNMPEVLALGDAIEFQKRRGIAAGAERLRALWTHARARVEAEPGIVWRSPVRWEQAASLWAIQVPGHAAEQVFEALWPEHGLVVRAFGGARNALRVSPNLVNTEADIDRLVAAIRQEVLG